MKTKFESVHMGEIEFTIYPKITDEFQLTETLNSFTSVLSNFDKYNKQVS